MRRNIKEYLKGKYDANFSYIEKVINSCKTVEQLKSAVSWGLDYLIRISKHEQGQCSRSEYRAVDNYAGEKEAVIMGVFHDSLELLNP